MAREAERPYEISNTKAFVFTSLGAALPAAAFTAASRKMRWAGAIGGA